VRVTFVILLSSLFCLSMNARTAFDLIFRRAATRSADTPVDIGVSDGRIVAIASRLGVGSPRKRVDGRLVRPALSTAHSPRQGPVCSAAVGTTTAASIGHSRRRRHQARLHGRGRLCPRRRVLERAIVHGTTPDATHVEMDPRIGLRGF